MKLWLVAALAVLPTTALLVTATEKPTAARQPQRAALSQRRFRSRFGTTVGGYHESVMAQFGRSEGYQTPGMVHGPVTTTGFIYGFGTTMTPSTTTTAEGDDTWRLFMIGGGTTTTTTTTTTGILQGVGPPPCNFTRNERGDMVPLECTTFNDPKTGKQLWSCKALKFFSELKGCYAPAVVPCASDLGLNQQRFESHGRDYEHLATRTITCAQGTVPISGDVPITTWGEKWYPGRKESTTECRMGTWTNLDWKEWGATKPRDLLCVATGTVALMREVNHMLQWSKKMKAETLAGGYQWIDASANARMGGLTNAITNAELYLSETMTGKIAPDFALSATIEAMNLFRMVPHGVPFTQETCKDFEKHFLWQLEKTNGGALATQNYIPPNAPEGTVPLVPAVSFTCNFAIEKVGVGYDPFSRTTAFNYRDGCFCDSKWPTVNGGCPFQPHMTPNYQAFGFDTMQIKTITHAGGANSNALCWYWSKNAHPEWGYLPNPQGYHFQNAPKNTSDLLKGTNERTAEYKASLA